MVAPPLLLPALVLLMDVATEDVDPLGEGVELTALFAEVAVVELLSSDCGGREDDTADVAAVVGTTVVTLPFAVLEAFPGMELPVDVLVAVGEVTRLWWRLLSWCLCWRWRLCCLALPWLSEASACIGRSLPASCRGPVAGPESSAVAY